MKRHSVIRTATGEQLTQAKGAAITQDHPARAILALRSIGGMMPGADFCHIRRAVQGHSRWEPGLAACYSAIAAHVLYNIIRQHCCLAQRLTA